MTRLDTGPGKGGGLTKSPPGFDSVTVPGGNEVMTWNGKEFTHTMVRERPMDMTWYSPDRRVPPTVGLVLDLHEPEDWNDMTEDEREDAISEFEKVHSLRSMGVDPPLTDPQALAVARMQARAVANNLAREMDAHKRKLEQELKAYEAQEKLYEGNAIFGAF